VIRSSLEIMYITSRSLVHSTSPELCNYISAVSRQQIESQPPSCHASEAALPLVAPISVAIGGHRLIETHSTTRRLVHFIVIARHLAGAFVPVHAIGDATESSEEMIDDVVEIRNTF
jgi:hypothetical protein